MPALVAVERLRLDEQAYRALRRAILRGELPAGARLVQEELAGRMGTSRLPVRDALRRLERDGLVERDRRGTYRVVAWDRQAVEELYQVRLLLEPVATARAARRLQPRELEDLRRLHGELRRAAQAGDGDAFVDGNYRFHFTIYRACGNRRLAQAIEALWSGLPPLVPVVLPGWLARAVREHGEVLRQLEARSVQGAAAAMREHIRGARQALLATLRTRGLRAEEESGEVSV